MRKIKKGDISLILHIHYVLKISQIPLAKKNHQNSTLFIFSSSDLNESTKKMLSDTLTHLKVTIRLKFPRYIRLFKKHVFQGRLNVS